MIVVATGWALPVAKNERRKSNFGFASTMVWGKWSWAQLTSVKWVCCLLPTLKVVVRKVEDCVNRHTHPRESKHSGRCRLSLFWHLWLTYFLGCPLRPSRLFLCNISSQWAATEEGRPEDVHHDFWDLQRCEVSSAAAKGEKWDSECAVQQTQSCHWASKWAEAYFLWWVLNMQWSKGNLEELSKSFNILSSSLCLSAFTNFLLRCSGGRHGERVAWGRSCRAVEGTGAGWDTPHSWAPIFPTSCRPNSHFPWRLSFFNL